MGQIGIANCSLINAYGRNAFHFICLASAMFLKTIFFSNRDVGQEMVLHDMVIGFSLFVIKSLALTALKKILLNQKMHKTCFASTPQS